MILEYQIKQTGLDRFLAQQKTIESVLDRNSRKGAQRDKQRESARARTTESATDKIADIESKALEKKLAKDERLKERSVQREMRQQERLVRWRQNLQNRHYQQIESNRRRLESREEAQTRRHQATLERTRSRYASGIARTTVGAFGNAGRTMVRGAAVGAGALGIGAGMMVEGAVRSRVGLDTSLRRVANAGYIQGGPKSREDIYGETKTIVDEIAKKGSDPAAIAEGLQAILAKTGNFNVASKGIAGVEKIAVATGTDVGEMATTFGSSIESIMRNNPGMSADDAVSQAMELSRTLSGHGKFGSVEVSDVASQGGKIVGAASRFTGDNASNMADMSTLLQQAIKGGAVNAEDAATAVKNIPNDLMKAQNRLGVSESVLYDAQGKYNKIEDILPAIFEKAGGKQTSLFGEGNTFGMQSQSAIIPLLDAWKNAGGGAGGAQAVRDLFEQFRGQTMSQQEVDESYQFANQGQSREFDSAMNEFKREVGDQLLPVIREMTPRLRELGPPVADLANHFVDFAAWFSENPLTGLGAIFGALVAKDIAAAGISSLVSSSIAGLMNKIMAMVGGGTLPTPGGPALGPKVGGKLGKLGKFGRIGAGLAAGVGTLALGYGVSEVAHAWGDQIDNDAAARATDADLYNNTALANYAGLTGTGSSMTSSAGMDPNLPGSPAAIQANFGAPTNGSVKLDSTELVSQLSEQNKGLVAALDRNTVATREAARKSSDPIIRRHQ